MRFKNKELDPQGASWDLSNVGLTNSDLTSNELLGLLRNNKNLSYIDFSNNELSELPQEFLQAITNATFKELELNLENNSGLETIYVKEMDINKETITKQNTIRHTLDPELEMKQVKNAIEARSTLSNKPMETKTISTPDEKKIESIQFHGVTLTSQDNIWDLDDKDIQENDLTSKEFLDLMQKNKNLVHINLSNNKIADYLPAQFLDAITNSTVESVDLKNNGRQKQFWINDNEEFVDKKSMSGYSELDEKEAQQSISDAIDKRNLNTNRPKEVTSHFSTTHIVKGITSSSTMPIIKSDITPPPTLAGLGIESNYVDLRSPMSNLLKQSTENRKVNLMKYSNAIGNLLEAIGKNQNSDNKKKMYDECFQLLNDQYATALVNKEGLTCTPKEMVALYNKIPPEGRNTWHFQAEYKTLIGSFKGKANELCTKFKSDGKGPEESVIEMLKILSATKFGLFDSKKKAEQVELAKAILHFDGIDVSKLKDVDMIEKAKTKLITFMKEAGKEVQANEVKDKKGKVIDTQWTLKGETKKEIEETHRPSPRH